MTIKVGQYSFYRFPGFWVDVDFPIIVRTTGVGRPVMTAVKGNVAVPLWAVGDNLNIEGQEIIHGHKRGTPKQWHIHMINAQTDTTDRYVKWQIEWFWGNANGPNATVIEPLSDTIITTSPDLLIPANTPQCMLVREIEMVDVPEIDIGAHIYALLTRVAATGAAPTGDVFASMLQMHVFCDAPGSAGMVTKTL